MSLVPDLEEMNGQAREGAIQDTAVMTDNDVGGWWRARATVAAEAVDGVPDGRLCWGGPIESPVPVTRTVHQNLLKDVTGGAKRTEESPDIHSSL